MGMDNIEALLEQSGRHLAMTPAVITALDDVGDHLAALAVGHPEPALGARQRGAVTAIRRRRRRVLLTGALGLTLAGIAGPAAVDFVGLHTGFFGSDDGRYGEFLNLASPDGLKVLRRFEQQYPLPSGGSWTNMETGFQKGPSGVGQEGVFENAVAGESRCQWTKTWLIASASGDTAAAARSLGVLGQIPTWHDVTAYQDSTHSESHVAQAIADGARAGDLGPAMQFVEANCTDGNPARG